MGLGGESLGEWGQEERTALPATRARGGMLQSFSSTIFVFLSYGTFQAYARVLKPLLDTLLCTRNRQALGYIAMSRGNPDRMEPTF